MRILFTGGSSFTGYWFATDLAQSGHEVIAVFRKKLDNYSDPVRRQRVERLASLSRGVVGCSFGDEAFLETIKRAQPQVLCHHAADVTNYKSPDFDAVAALAQNTRNLSEVLRVFQESGGQEVVLTGSVFEGGEGAGSQGLPDFSPYGLSKSFTASMFRFYCQRAGVPLAKFVIPNPFGPFEEPRFTAYLMKSWLAGGTPNCSSPAYIRDNIHVSLLARAYSSFVAASDRCIGFRKINPSGYAESQGAFTLRLAQEMRPRLKFPCEVEIKKQLEFPEPRVRINTDIPDTDTLGWDESAAWDGMAAYYLENFRPI